MLIFSPHKMKYISYSPKKKVNFLFILYSTEIKKAQPYFFLGHFMLDLAFAVCLLSITLGGNIVCTMKMAKNNILTNETQEIGI